MLDPEEFVEIYNSVADRLEACRREFSNPEDVHQLMQRISLDMGLSEQLTMGFIGFALERMYEVPEELVYMLQPQAPRVAFMALAVGIEAGKHIERVTHPREEE